MSDQVELILSEGKKALIAEVMKQPIEGLLYDLDLLPEQFNVGLGPKQMRKVHDFIVYLHGVVSAPLSPSSATKAEGE